MRRLFWLAMGITIGALVVRKLSRAAEKMTPGGIAGSIAEALRDLADAIGEFGADVREAMAERESGAALRHRPRRAAARRRPPSRPSAAAPTPPTTDPPVPRRRAGRRRAELSRP